MRPSAPTPAPGPLVPWILWFAILSGLLVMQFVVGGGIPQGADRGMVPALQQYGPLAPACLALLVRFLVLPRMNGPEQRLPVMLVGLALAEATGFLGLFLVEAQFPASKLVHFVVAILTILLFAPLGSKFGPQEDPYTR